MMLSSTVRVESNNYTHHTVSGVMPLQDWSDFVNFATGTVLILVMAAMNLPPNGHHDHA